MSHYVITDTGSIRVDPVKLLKTPNAQRQLAALKKPREQPTKEVK